MDITNISTDYKKIKGGDNTYLKISIYYSLGGVNYFSGHTEQRGYYMSLTPVERGAGWESTTAYSGIKDCMVECARKSAKAESKALAMKETTYAKLLDYMKTVKGLELE